MRILFLVLATALTTTSSFARERAFRVVGDTAVESGFALAWGMKGKELDFEALDRLPDTRPFFEENQDQLVNYLVDLENETILDTVQEPALVGRAGDNYVLRNHDSVGLLSVPVEGTEHYEHGLVLVSQHKWFNELSKLLIVKRSAADSVITFESRRIGNDIENAILAKLSSAQRKKFVDYQGAVTWQLRQEIDANYEKWIVVDAEAVRPKQDDPSLLINAKLQLKLETNGIKVSVQSASLREGQ